MIGDKKQWLASIQTCLTLYCKNPKLIHNLKWKMLEIANTLQNMERELKRMDRIYSSASDVAWGESPEIKHCKLIISIWRTNLYKTRTRLRKELNKP